MKIKSPLKLAVVGGFGRPAGDRGASVFGGAGSVVGTFAASFIIGAINAGIVSTGINAFYTQLAFGLVIVISVVLQT